MRTIRRLYLYGVAFISLFVTLWGFIGLARSFWGEAASQRSASDLASALALLVVGIPVLGLHWYLAQKQARTNTDERFARLRAVFLYAALLGTGIPISQNALALLNRLLFQLAGANQQRLFFGAGQTLSDNAIAILVNGLAAAWLFNTLRQNWQGENPNDPFHETRRLYRLIWVLYGLFLLLSGLNQGLLFLFDSLSKAPQAAIEILLNGLAATLIGVPTWATSWRIAQRDLVTPPEQESLLRQVFLYLIRLLATIVTLAGGVVVLDTLLKGILGEISGARDFWGALRNPLAIAIPMGLVWAYHHRALRREIGDPADPSRGAIRQFAAYALSLAGLMAAFTGLHRLLFSIIDFSSWTEGLAALSVGLPVWLLTWLPQNRLAADPGKTGQATRNALTRRGYLYLVLFVGVLGVMISAGNLVYKLFEALLGGAGDDFGRLIARLFGTLLLFSLLLGYHAFCLRADGLRMAKAAAAQQADFPVLVLAAALGAFTEAMVAALRKETPALPVAVHLVDQGAPDETLSNAKAVILPASVTANPPEAVRLWVQNFTGVRFIVPTPVRGWVWVSGSGDSPQALIAQTAGMVRKLAEGEADSRVRISLWMLVGYLLGGLTALWGVLVLLQALIEFLSYS